MEIIYIGDRNPKNRALLISNKEWKRLGQVLTKKEDEKNAIEISKHLKEMRSNISKKMVNSWDNTELNKTKKILEQKRKTISELEVKREQRDKEMKQEALETRNRIIEKSRKLKFEERDVVKTFQRAVQHSTVFKERAIQLKFIEAERIKKMEKNLILAREQNKEAEQYRKDQIDEKQKNNELKKTKAEILLKELKYRENNRRAEDIALYESGKIEMQKITGEINKICEETSAKVQAEKQKLQKNIADNQKLIAENKEKHQREEEEEELVTSIMAETKKILAKMRRLKEIELMEVRYLALEEMRKKLATWPKAKENVWEESDVQNAVEALEKRYRDEKQKKKDLAKKKVENAESGKKLWEEEIARQQKQLIWNQEQEDERREREKKILAEFVQLRKRKQIENIKKFRQQLDKQCNDKKLELMTDRQADINRYKTFEQQWHEEDKEFITYARNIIEKSQLVGNPTIPLLKVVNDYLEKNNLQMGQDKTVSKKLPKYPIYTSKIIPYAN